MKHLLLILFVNIVFLTSFSQKRDNELGEEKIQKLIHWLKSTSPISAKTEWYETCQILVDWSVLVNQKEVVINTDVIEGLLIDSLYKYRQETVQMYVLSVISYNIDKRHKYTQKEATYLGIVDTINFYHLLKKEDDKLFSEAIEQYEKMKKKRTLRKFINDKS